MLAGSTSPTWPISRTDFTGFGRSAPRDREHGRGSPRALTSRRAAPHDVGQTTERESVRRVRSAPGGPMVVEQDTRLRILAAAKGVLLDVGYAKLSTRGIAEAAGVPLSQ